MSKLFPKFFRSMNLDEHWVQAAVVANGLVRLVAMLLTMAVIERFGRRAVLLTGNSICIILLATFVALSYTTSGNDIQAYLSILVIFAHSVFNPGPSMIGFLMGTELSPHNVRHKVQSIAISVNGLAALLSIMLYPVLHSAISHATLLIMYVVPLAISTVYLYFAMPETKGREIDEIVKEIKSLVT